MPIKFEILGDNSQFLDSMREVQRSVNSTTKAVTDAFNKQAAAVEKLTKETEELNAEIQKAEKAGDTSGLDEKRRKYEELSQQLQEAKEEFVDLQQTFGKGLADGGGNSVDSAKSRLRQLKDEITNLTLEYRSMSDAEQQSARGQALLTKIQQLTDEAGDLRDAMDDANSSIKNVASDTRHFDALVGGLNTAASAFGAVTGAASLFGVEEENLAEVQTKLQAALALTNSLSAIQANIQKESALMTGIKTLQDKASAAATEMKTLAEGKNIVVTKAATVAQAAFNLVAKANPYVLLASAILAVGTAFVLFSKRAKEATAEEKKQQEQTKRLEKTHKDFANHMRSSVGNSVGEVTAKFMSLRDQWLRLKSVGDQVRWIQNNQSSFGALGLSINNVNSAYQVFVAQAPAVVAALQAIAAAEAMKEVKKDAIKKYYETKYFTSDEGKTVENGGRYRKVSAGAKISEEEMKRAGIDAYAGDLTMSGRGAVLSLAGAEKVNQMRLREAAKIHDDNMMYWARIVNQISADEKKADALAAELSKGLPWFKNGLNSYKNGGFNIGAGGGGGHGGSGGGGGGGSTWDANEAKYESEKAVNEWKQSMLDLLEEANQEIADAEVEFMDESTKKTIAAIDEDEKKQLAALKEKMEDIIEERRRLDIELWVNASAKNKESNYTEKTDDEYIAEIKADMPELLEAMASRVEQVLRDAKKKREDVYKEIANKEFAAMNEYLKQYGSMEERRLAIAKDYEMKISQAKIEGEKLRLQAEAKKAMEDFDLEILRKEIDWQTLFNGVGDVLYDEMKASLDKVEAYIKSDNFKTLNAADQQAMLDMRNNLRQKTGSGVGAFNFGIYGKIARDLEEYQKAVLESKEAHRAHKAALDDVTKREEELAKATNDSDKAIAKSNLAFAKQKAAMTKERAQDADANVAETKNEVVVDTNNAQSALDNFGRALQQMSTGTLKGFADGLINVINAISGNGKNNGLSGLGKAGGIIGAILTILDALGDDAAKFFDDLFQKVTTAVENLLKGLFTDAVPAIVQGVLHLVEGVINGVVGMIGSIFGANFDLGHFLTGDNVEKVAKTTEELTKANKVLADRISNMTDVISDSPMSKALNAYTIALDAQKELNKNNMEILMAQMGYHQSHHSNASYADDDVIRSMSGAAYKAFDAAGVKASMINGLSSIYNLTPEQLKAIKDFAPDLWKYLTEVGKYDKSEYWDAVVEQAGKVEELTKAINENLTSVTFDNVYDGFKALLSDLDSDSHKFAENFEQYMFDAILNQRLSEGFKQRLEEWYETFAEMSKNGLDENEIQRLRESYLSLGEEGRALRDEVQRITNYGSSSEGSATYNAAKSFTQEQGDVLNGRLAAIQIAVRENNVIGQQIAASLKGMESLSSASNAVMEIRNMMIYTNSYLEDIARYARQTYNDFGERLDRIVQKTQNL